MLNESTAEMDRYKNVIEQLDIERKKLGEEKATQELINLKMAEEMAALQKQQPDPTHFENTLRRNWLLTTTPDSKPSKRRRNEKDNVLSPP